mmetsp:Transcript_14726/g.57760  ORF Transcript_14726/g.57760 Transcript_14726/m.57760 type:complete len:352 (+) Transcript_14726:59-1114(+)|eukprot:CAMPEP_0114622642 /NCGR_PEP_ID=MMETSP0168-20121206/9842_1 /TAXON_ID=95228 ORGANISM="Vannella sp., Strain DIVA3 517/6/12" /NCGR_SAMPLE_ID=MMETSP0168 /ASSEMBLY_ACC=CAM_ASM_000044 /LENGTH=351 /DNA_ID=CAMNT_0001833863 /DNA_START=55 /DNA_END=1110 /DNA_ORIENTATION=-
MKEVDIEVPLADTTHEEQYARSRAVVAELTGHGHWTQAEQEERIHIIPFTLGLTNLLFKAEVEGEGGAREMMVRVYGAGTGALVDRERELAVLQSVDDELVVGAFANGVVLAFKPGKCLRPHQIDAPAMQARIGAGLARLHRRRMPGAPADARQFWATLRSWTRDLIERVPDYTFESFDGKKFAAKDLMTELEETEAYFSTRNDLPVVLCHNDLNAENCIFDEASDTMTFVDYEYTCTAYRGFDIGNHFCEYAGIDTNLDFSGCYPSREAQRPFLAAYLRESGKEATEEEVAALFEEANACAQLSNLFWGVWGVLQDTFSTLDFDFTQYGTRRLQEYYSRIREPKYPLRML